MKVGEDERALERKVGPPEREFALQNRDQNFGPMDFTIADAETRHPWKMLNL
jgi:hypothetical protein